MSEPQTNVETTPEPSPWEGKPPAFTVIIGALSFIPMCGVLFGLIAIIWGAFTLRYRRGRRLALMGALGICFTALVYGGLVYVSYNLQNGGFTVFTRPLSQSNINSLVQAIEFYKLQEGAYPEDLEALMISGHVSNPATVLDPMVGFSAPSGNFYYELLTDQDGYYLLGVGKDLEPFTPDDIIPSMDAQNIGLVIHQGSRE